MIKKSTTKKRAQQPQKGLKKKLKKQNKLPKTPARPALMVEKIQFKKGEIIEITPDMIIGDVVLAYPETLPVLQKIGIHCVGCYASTFESIQEGVLRHGIDPLKVCKDLNKAIINTSIAASKTTRTTRSKTKH